MNTTIIIARKTIKVFGFSFDGITIYNASLSAADLRRIYPGLVYDGKKRY